MCVQPGIYKLSGGAVHEMDLASVVHIGQRVGWSISIEVGEHVSSDFQTNFVMNLIKHAQIGACAQHYSIVCGDAALCPQESWYRGHAWGSQAQGTSIVSRQPT